MTVEPPMTTAESETVPETPKYRLGRITFAVLFLGASLVFLASVALFIFDAFGLPLPGS